MEAIGILESNSIAKGIEAADAILKAADTSLLFSKPRCPGKYTTLFYGDVAAVAASLEVGERRCRSKYGGLRCDSPRASSGSSGH
ncbi:BMC domain-containing protein [Hungatella sp.]|uniref:BMC domain-containing protein n=1 Tax=Hungatella sp. TaxID=2613924 RepID=UPI003993B755